MSISHQVVTAINLIAGAKAREADIDLILEVLESDHSRFGEIRKKLGRNYGPATNISRTVEVIIACSDDRFNLLADLITPYIEDFDDPVEYSDSYRSGVITGIFSGLAHCGGDSLQRNCPGLANRLFDVITSRKGLFKGDPKWDSEALGHLKTAVQTFAGRCRPQVRSLIDKFALGLAAELTLVGDTIAEAIVYSRFRNLGTLNKAVRLSDLKFYGWRSKGKKEIYVCFHIGYDAALAAIRKEFPDLKEITTVKQSVFGSDLRPGNIFVLND